MKFLQREHDNSGFDDRGALANLIEWHGRGSGGRVGSGLLPKRCCRRKLRGAF
jgi:hypothetical protein